jgi:hypothetical protein
MYACVHVYTGTVLLTQELKTKMHYNIPINILGQLLILPVLLFIATVREDHAWDSCELSGQAASVCSLVGGYHTQDIVV